MIGEQVAKLFPFFAARLRNRQFLGFKFRRQYPIENYVVDFVCAECALVVELDGDSHGAQMDYDKKRTHELNEIGYDVLRFTNRQVVSDLESVLESILLQCQLFQKRHRPSSPPSPRAGEKEPIPSP